MTQDIHLHLAKIVASYQRLLSILPLERWAMVKEEADPIRSEVDNLAFSISRSIDCVREILDDRILQKSAEFPVSEKAKVFFGEILPRSEEITSLWLNASGLGDLDFPLEVVDSAGEARELLVTPKVRSNDEPVYLNTISEIIDWRLDGVWSYLEDGGTDGYLIVPNDVYERARRITRAKFFCPDQWYENLQKINPVVANPKKLPRDVSWRVREVQCGLIVGNFISAVVLCRSILEYALIERGKNHNIDVIGRDGKPKGLAELVSDYAERHPERELDMQVIKRAGDRCVHAELSKSNVVHFPKVGIGEAVKSWNSLRAALEWLYS